MFKLLINLLLTMELKLEVLSKKKIKVELMNFKDRASQEICTEIPSSTEVFSNVQPVLKPADTWIKLVKAHCKKAFKGIRIRKQTLKPSRADKLISKRNKFIKQGLTDT